MNDAIAIRPSPGRGRGVFAKRALEEGELVETAPALTLSLADTDAIEDTSLKDFYFAHPGDPLGGLLVLGLATLSNHSDEPNVETSMRHDQAIGWIVEMRTLRDIAPDEEITRRYACDLWFDSV